MIGGDEDIVASIDHDAVLNPRDVTQVHDADLVFADDDPPDSLRRRPRHFRTH